MHNPFDEVMQAVNEVKEAIYSISNIHTPQPEIITPAELNKRLQISEPTRIRWSKRGVIPEIRIGVSVRYNWPAVVAQLEKQSK